MKLKRVALLALVCLLLVFAANDATATEDQYVSYDEAVAQARAGLVAREDVITVYLQSATDLGDAVYMDVYQDAIAHTGVPNEGDYLRRNMSGCQYGAVLRVENGIYYYEITLEPYWLADAQQEAEVDAAVDALLDELALWDATNYEKIVGVYNWITENVQYDFDNVDDTTYMLKFSTYSAMVQKNTVCQGYATLLYRLLLSLGVDCRLISGDGDGENHAWNIVYLDGKYYNVDATWDRDLMGHYRYFLCTEENFGFHTRDKEFTTDAFNAQYPMAVVPYVFNVTASGTIRPGMEWVLDGSTGTLTVAGTGAIPSYRFSEPPWYQYRESVKSIVVSEGITEVGERAFYWCTNCTSVSLPSTLTAIREYGFNNLRALQYITLPENLKIIEFCAFSECAALKSITLPDSVVTVGPSAFSNCPSLFSATLSAGMTSVPNSMFFNDVKLQIVNLPEGITSIGNTAFSGCALRSFHFPATLTNLGSSVFGDSHYMQSYTVAAGNPSFKSINGVLFSADGKTLLAYPGGKYGAYTVPTGTETIASSAFRGCRNLTSINFGTTLKTIGDYSFSYCTGLSSVTFPANVTRICDSAFRSCTYLTSITFQNDSVVLESGGVFAQCDYLYSITLPAKITEIPGYLFYGCERLSNITIPSTAKSIGSSAFLDCDNLRTITIPGNVKSIGRQAFDFCNKLETIICENGVQRLEDYCIRNAPALKKVVLPATVTSIGRECFDVCPNVVLHVECNSSSYSYAVSHGLSRSINHTYSNTQVYWPNCTQQGYTLYSCRCGQYSYESDYVPATGHDYVNHVTPPTCTSQGYTTHTCSVCYDSYMDSFVNKSEHTYVNGVCSVCGEYYVKFQSASISLAGNIAINFYVELGQPILDDAGAYMRFTLPDGTAKTVALSDAEVSVKNGVTRYAFTCAVHAKQMADMVVAQMHLGDGTAVGDSRSYSVVTYAGYIIAHEDQYAAYPSLVKLLKAMLNYGAYSQIHFGYNVNNLANAGLNLTLNDVTRDDVSAYRVKRAGSMTGLSITSVTLILRSETVLRFYYTLSSGYNIQDYNFIVNGKSVWPQYNESNGRYYVDVTNIAAKDLDREYGVTVTNKAGTESLSVIASAMSYVYQVILNPTYFTQDVKDVVKAMYAYNIAANAYFK